MHLSAAALADFYRQLATYLDAGMPIVRALDTLSSKRGKAAKAAKNLSRFVEQGMGLADAMGKTQTFTSLDVRLIDAAEKSGRLPNILRNLAEALDKARGLRNQFIIGLIYPLLVFHAGIFVVTVVKTLLHTDAQGVPYVKMDLMSGLCFGAMCLLPPYGIALTCYILTCIGRSVKSVGDVLGAFALALPVFGKIRRHMAMSRFFRAMYGLYVAGANTADALVISAKACGNPVLMQKLLPASEVVARGDSFSAAMDVTGLLTVDESAFIETGCESGRLDEMLLRIAVELEDKAGRAAKLAARVVPFIAMLFIGGLIIYFIISLMGSYINMLNNAMDG